MTESQKQILKTDITVTRANTVYNGQTLLQYWNNNDMEALAAFYNQVASPQVDLWRPDIKASELAPCLAGTEYSSATTGKQNQLIFYTIAAGDGFLDATNANIRAGFANIFASGTTLNNLMAMSKKAATNFESLFKGAIQGTAYVSTAYKVVVTAQDITQTKFG